MTATRDVTIWCDGIENGHSCDNWHSGDTAKDVRAELGRPGSGRWLVGLPGGRDLCPEHHDQRNLTTGFGHVAAPSDGPVDEEAGHE